MFRLSRGTADVHRRRDVNRTAGSIAYLTCTRVLLVPYALESELNSVWKTRKQEQETWRFCGEYAVTVEIGPFNSAPVRRRIIFRCYGRQQKRGEALRAAWRAGSLAWGLGEKYRYRGIVPTLLHQSCGCATYIHVLNIVPS